MGNKPYLAMKPADSDGDFVDLSDNLLEITMHSNFPFEEFQDASISVGGQPAVKLTEGIVAAVPRIRIPCGTQQVSVAEVIVDLNSKAWWEATGSHLIGLCIMEGKATFNGVSQDIRVVGSVVDVNTTQERVPAEGEEFGTSEMFRVLGLTQLPNLENELRDDIGPS